MMYSCNWTLTTAPNPGGLKYMYLATDIVLKNPSSFSYPCHAVESASEISLSQPYLCLHRLWLSEAGSAWDKNLTNLETTWLRTSALISGNQLALWKDHYLAITGILTCDNHPELPTLGGTCLPRLQALPDVISWGTRYENVNYGISNYWLTRRCVRAVSGYPARQRFLALSSRWETRGTSARNGTILWSCRRPQPGTNNLEKTAFDKFKTGFEFAHGRRGSKRCPFTKPLSISTGLL